MLQKKNKIMYRNFYYFVAPIIVAVMFDCLPQIYCMPPSVAHYFNQSNEYFSAEKSKLSKTTPHIKPPYVDGLVSLATQLAFHNKIKDAIHYYNYVAQLNPTYYELYRNNTTLYINLQDYDTAYNYFNQTITNYCLYPKMSPKKVIGQTHNFFPLEQDYRITITLEECAYEYHTLATLLKLQARYEQALATYYYATVAQPHTVSYGIDLGYIYIMLGKTEDACKEYTTILQIDPNNMYAWYHIAYVDKII